MRKPAFCILYMQQQQRRSAAWSAECFCFRYIDSIIPLLPKSEMRNVWSLVRFSHDSYYYKVRFSQACSSLYLQIDRYMRRQETDSSDVLT